MYNSEYFVDEDGLEPARDFIDGLPPKVQAKFQQIRLNYVHAFGPQTSDKILRKVEEFREIRWMLKYRVMCYLPATGNTYVMLHGFIKKTQKTPPEEIQRARRYKSIDEKIRKKSGN